MKGGKARGEQSRKLIDQLEGDPAFGPLTAVLATTFDLTPDFVELDFLPSVLRVPAWDDRRIRARVQLEAELGRLDAVCLLQEARRFQGRPRSLRVHVTPASSNAGGVLHAKVTLLVYADAVRLIVASANLTPSGYRSNREVAVAFTAGPKRREEAVLILDAVNRMPAVLAEWWSPSAERVVGRARQLLVTWASGEAPVNERFVWSDGATALWPQFLQMWPAGEAVERIRIVSPFWSDATEDSPVPTLLRELRSRGARVDGARLELLTAADPASGEKGIPVLPPSYGAFDFKALGVQASALAVKTRVDVEDVERDDILRERALHAKVVLMDGPKTRLAYAGSANFTAPGWGFAARANIEAGVIILRPRKDTELEKALLPPTPFPPVPLDGSGAASLVAPAVDDGQAPWPSFLRSVELRPEGGDPDRLELVAAFAEGPQPTEWSLSLAHADAALMDQSTASGVTCAVRMDGPALRALLREQAVLVRWSELGQQDPVRFPVNVALEVRETLPFGDPDSLPTEGDLVAFYQGRVSLEDLFSSPDDPEDGPSSRASSAGDASGVDTSRILSYQVRAFVESLTGLRAELARNTATESTIRLAFLGPVSPLALGKEVMRAVAAGRSPTAAGFQLVELLRCLADVKDTEVPPKLKEAWNAAVGQVRTALGRELDGLRASALAGDERFRDYADAILGRTVT